MRDLCGDGDLSCGQAEAYGAGDGAVMVGLRLSCVVPAAFDTLERSGVRVCVFALLLIQITPDHEFPAGVPLRS